MQGSGGLRPSVAQRVIWSSKREPQHMFSCSALALMPVTTPIAAATYLAERDPVLARIIHRIPEPLYGNTHNVFEDLASCVLDMRIHYAGSKAAFRYKRFKRLMNDAPLAPDSLGTMPREVLTELKLSRQKHETLELLGAFWRAERLDEVEWTGLTDAEVLDRLAGVKGIGEWTVQMVLIFTLERPDILPMTDYQFRKAMC